MSTDGIKLDTEAIRKLFNSDNIQKRKPVYKKRKCQVLQGKSIHRFNGEKPFDWQKCMCKRFTFGQLEELNRQSVVEKKGEAVV
jgi:hypothetical protein